jgi:hypothetical protein
MKQFYWEVKRLNKKTARMVLLWRGVHAWVRFPARHIDDRRYLALCLRDVRYAAKLQLRAVR